MTGRHGKEEHGELWIRCPFCGDSPNDLTKAHFSVNLKTGAYHCHRCKVGGFLSTKRRMALAMHSESTLSEQRLIDYDQLIPGAGSSRRSLLPRFHFRKGEEVWDAFEMRNPKSGEVAGIHLRRPGASHTMGNGVAWATRLLSSEDQPLRLVEGPYDVLYPEDLCCFGLPSTKILRALMGHYVILCPDGDVWENEDLKRQILKLLWGRSRCNIIGIEYIKDGKDPDEVPVEDRELIPTRVIKQLWRSKKRWQLESNQEQW